MYKIYVYNVKYETTFSKYEILCLSSFRRIIDLLEFQKLILILNILMNLRNIK
jgi:hypothetical protein